ERPIELVAARLRAVEKLLDVIDAPLSAVEVPPEHKQTLDQVRALLDYAARVEFLAAANGLALLREDSDVSRRFAQQQRAYEAKAKELGRAEQATRGWRHKLSPEDTESALELAKQLEGRFWSFLRPSWWRLRGTLRRAYDFRAQGVK